jgi:hypothetical protein
MHTWRILTDIHTHTHTHTGFGKQFIPEDPEEYAALQVGLFLRVCVCVCVCVCEKGRKRGGEDVCLCDRAVVDVYVCVLLLLFLKCY